MRWFQKSVLGGNRGSKPASNNLHSVYFAKDGPLNLDSVLRMDEIYPCAEGLHQIKDSRAEMVHRPCSGTLHWEEPINISHCIDTK